MKISDKARELVLLLCNTAQKGLIDCYQSKNGFMPDLAVAPLTMADNIRYLVIAQIGIKRWERYNHADKAILPDLWDVILKGRSKLTNVGDLGLAIWAALESDSPLSEAFAAELSSKWSSQRANCTAVELAWVVLGLGTLVENKNENLYKEVLANAHQTLLSLYKSETRLFFRHSRKGALNCMSRGIACFADQIYPVLALANYGRYFNDEKSIEVASSVADMLCESQGPLGQWMWHYDVAGGRVAEEYPIFSVHQHGMAPMALLAIDEITGMDHSKYIELGLTWLTGRNELNLSMIQQSKGVVWRDIQRREMCKIFRFVRGGLALLGWDSIYRFAGKRWFGYAINDECRPYELGWLLYAWASFANERRDIFNNR